MGSLKAMADYWESSHLPMPKYEHFPVDRDRVTRLFDRVRSDGRFSLGDAEARDVMEAYGFRIPRSVLAKTVDEAVEAARMPTAMANCGGTGGRAGSGALFDMPDDFPQQFVWAD